MKKRVIGILLAICTLLGMIPSIALSAETIIERFVDPVDPSIGGNDILKMLEQAAPAVPDGLLTPYGTGSSITLLEKSELYTHIPGEGAKIEYKGLSSNQLQAGLPRTGPAADLMFTQAVAFDPTGCGRKNHIAVLGFYPIADNLATRGAAAVYIYNMDTNTLVKSYTKIESSWINFAWDSLDTVDANNYFSITAGDYNGDGRDSLVFYCGHIMLYPSLGYAAGLYEVSFNGTDWSKTNVTVDRSGNEYINKEYIKYSYDHRSGLEGYLEESRHVGDRLCVSLASGDLNGDGIDDLAVVSAAGNLTDNYKSAAYNACVPMLAVGRGSKGASGVNDLSVSNTELRVNWSSATYVAAAPDVSIGDLDGDGGNEVIVAGFMGKLNSNGRAIYIDSSKENAGIQYHMFRLNGGDLVTMAGDMLTGHANQLSAISYGDSLRASEQSWQQCSVECVSFDGLNSRAYVFVNGYVYQAQKGKYNFYELVQASGSDALDVPGGSQSDTNFGFNFLVTSCHGVDVNEVFIRSIAVGNMRRSNSGKECIEMIVGFKRNDGKGYYYQRVGISRDDKGTWKRFVPGYIYTDNTTPRTNSNSGCFVTDVDIYDSRVPDDTLTVRYSTTLSAYTDPNVVAFLQAAPYFSELGAGNSSTSYSYSESYTRSTSTGSEKTFGVGITAGFETPSVKTEIEASVSTSISKAFTESRTTEFTTTFEANNKNQVIIRRTLVYLYCYDVMTGIDANGNPTYEPLSLVVSVPQYPVLTSLSMEQYDAFAEAYNEKYGAGVEGSKPYYLDIISKNDGALMKKYYLNNEGNPFAYASDVSNYSGGFSMTNNGNWMELSHSGGISTLAYSTSVGFEQSKTVSDSASLNLAVSVGASFAGFGASAGITTSLSSLKSKGVSTAQVTTTATSGSVQNLTDDDMSYAFSWTLIGWKTNPGDGLFSGIPFVGYAVRSVSAPVASVNDLSAQYAADSPGKATLTWTRPVYQEGRPDARNFRIYRTDGGRREFLGATNGTSFVVTSNDISAAYIVVAYDASMTKASGDSNEVTVIFATTSAQVAKMIEDATEALKNAMESGQNEAIAKAVEDLTKAYKEADDLVKSGTAEDLAALEEKLTKADEALRNAIDAVQTNLDDAIENLTKLINDGDKENADALLKAITDLTTAYKAADDLLKTDIDALSDSLKALEEKLTKADEALQSSIDAVQKNLDRAIEELNKAIAQGDKVGSERLTEAVETLNTAYKAADELIKADIKAISDRLDALEAAMKEADEALKNQVDQVRDSLESEMEALRNELKSIKDQLEAQDRDNMQTVSSVNDRQQKELSVLKVVAVAGLCISVLALLGDIALLVQCIRKKH